jgi:SAM-dependent methyltransferase
MPDMVRRRAKCPSETTRAMLNVIQRISPEDEFVTSQWSVDLGYYRTRLEGLGLRGEVLVDMGCGAGTWALAAAGFVQKVVALDLSPTRLAVARQAAELFGIGNVSFMRSDARRAPLRDSAAAFVLLYNTLPYVPTWRSAIEEAARLLKPGGKLFLSWADSGMMLFHALRALTGGRVGELRLALRIAADRFGPLAGKAAGAPMTLSRKVVEEALRTHGFRLLWRSWVAPAAKNPLFPRRFCGAWFFHEVLTAGRRRARGGPARRGPSAW